MGLRKLITADAGTFSAASFNDVMTSPRARSRPEPPELQVAVPTGGHHADRQAGQRECGQRMCTRVDEPPDQQTACDERGHRGAHPDERPQVKWLRIRGWLVLRWFAVGHGGLFPADISHAVITQRQLLVVSGASSRARRSWASVARCAAKGGTKQ